jgi:hypothetical protein
MPHEGDWEQAGLWQASERFSLPFRVAQIGPTGQGDQPLSRSFLEVEPSTLHVSALKQSEDGKGWIVRLFNPLSQTVKGRIRLNGGQAQPSKEFSPVERQMADGRLPESDGKAWKTVRTVTLEEIPEDNLKLGKDGWVTVELGHKKIVSVEFRRV